MPHPSLRDTERSVFWTDRPDAPAPSEPLTRATQTDLLVVGGGFTGLWTALEAKARDPQRDVVLVEARSIAFGATGRNGGFISASLTHGHAHGEALWPREMAELVRLGNENLEEIEKLCADEGIDADLRLCGKTAVATTEHAHAQLAAIAEVNTRYGESVELLDADAVRADIASPQFLGGVRIRSGSGLMDPAALAWGLLDLARRRGVRIHEGTPVRRITRHGAGVRAYTPIASIDARQVMLATNAYPPLLRRLRMRFLPIFDHVLVTEPLTPEQQQAIGWSERQGLTDIGNQFHYTRPTRDGRILWGGYDANYYRGNRTDESLEERMASFELLARQFEAMFPALHGIRFTHRWAGLIDSTSRFTPAFGTAMGGRLGYVVGFTGLGTAMSRFGARTALDMLAGERTERTRLAMVRRKPVPFPPEPLRDPLVQATRRALAREDATGSRGAWLRTLDRFGLGFNS